MKKSTPPFIAVPCRNLGHCATTSGHDVDTSRLGAALLSFSLLAVGCSGERTDEVGSADASAMFDSDAAVSTTCIEVDVDIRADTNWVDHVAEPSEADYCINTPIVVLGGASLTIAPGTTVVFAADTSLRVSRAEGASLHAAGTAEAPIVLRGARAEAGFWQGVEIMSDDARNRLEHVRLSDAGGGGDVFADDELGGVAGALVLDAEPGAAAAAAVVDVTFERNLGFGLIVESISILREFASNAFIQNVDGAALVSQGNIHMMDPATSFSGNGFDGVSVTAVTNLELPRPVTWRALSSGSYWVREALEILSDVTIEAGATFVFDPETELSVPQNADDTAARFSVAGTSEDEVTFKGHDESAGSWVGLEIASGRENRIEHAVISHAGTGIRVRKAGAFAPARLEVLRSRIAQSSTCGIENTSTENLLTVVETEFSDNAADRCEP